MILLVHFVDFNVDGFSGRRVRLALRFTPGEALRLKCVGNHLCGDNRLFRIQANWGGEVNGV